MTQILGIDVIQWFEVAVAAVTTVVIANVMSWLMLKLLKKTKFPTDTERRLARAVKYAIYFSGSVVIVAFLAFDIIGAVVGIGFLGLAVSFGLAGVINNYVTGLVVILGRNFRVGDDIRLAYFEGKVFKLGISKTVLESRDGEIIFVPTAFFLSNPVARKSNRTSKTGEAN